MAKSKVLVLAQSGFGKSTSLCPTPQLDIEGLDPAKTFLVNVDEKPLPIKGASTHYEHIPMGKGEKPTKGNYLESNSFEIIARTIKYIAENRTDEFEYLVIDDFQYLMGDYYMANAQKGGYDVFKEIGAGIAKILAAAKRFKGHFIALSHFEQVQDGYGTTYKPKTVGKMIDNYLTLEGKFTICLYGIAHHDKKTKKTSKHFLTNFDGQYPAKSPYGMFDDLEIPNDLGYVVKKIEEYNS